jgi:hypothetical protein
VTIAAQEIALAPQIADWLESSQRQTDAIAALIDAIPEGLTRDEIESVVHRFAIIVSEAGLRRGLCRFERPGRAA